MLARHLRSNAVAYLALTIALGGTSYAAVNLPASSVGTRQIKSNAVTSAKVKDRSLKAADFATGQLPRGDAGPSGPRGEAGPAGARGVQGIQGVQGVTGPTFGTASMVNYIDATPPANPDGAQVFSKTFTLPSAGVVYLRLWAAFLLADCVGGPATAGLYLDGQPIPDASIVIFGATSTTPAASELVAAVPSGPGARTVSVAMDCPTGALTGAEHSVDHNWTVLLLGGPLPSG